MAQPVGWRGSRGGIISHPDRWQGSDGPQHHPTAPLGFTPADAWPVAKFPTEAQPQHVGSGRSRRAPVNKQKGLFQPPEAIPASLSQPSDNGGGRGVMEEGPERREWREWRGKAISNLIWGHGPGISRTRFVFFIKYLFAMEPINMGCSKDSLGGRGWGEHWGGGTSQSRCPARIMALSHPVGICNRCPAGKEQPRFLAFSQNNIIPRCSTDASMWLFEVRALFSCSSFQVHFVPETPIQKRISHPFQGSS